MRALGQVDAKPHTVQPTTWPGGRSAGYDIIEDMYSPRTAAMNLILELAAFKGKESLQKFITFLVGIFTQYNETPVEQRNYTQKDGALLAIGSLADRLKQTSPYKDALEDMLVRRRFQRNDQACCEGAGERAERWASMALRLLMAGGRMYA